MSSEARSTETPPPEDQAPRNLPNFLIIGAMRCGTTSLTRYLRPHPDVYVSPHKELHFFDYNFAEGLDRYRENFADAGSERAVGEATPNYIYDGDAMQRIADSLPQARLIAILRNPVDRAYSHYWHNRAVGRETLGFEDALAAEPDRLATTDPRPRAHWSYADRGLYLLQLQRVCDLCRRESLLVSLFDDLTRDPAGTYRSLCRFLRVDESFSPPELGVSVNSYVAFRSRAVRRVARRLPKPARRVVGRLNRRDDPSYPPMEPRVRARLLERFAEENAALGSWLDRDLSSWER